MKHINTSYAQNAQFSNVRSVDTYATVQQR